MLGSSLMACPFVKRGQEQRLVQVPEGDWYDFHSGEKVQPIDGVVVVRRRPGLVPLFVKAGHTIVCFEGGLQTTKDADKTVLQFHYFPGEGEHSNSFVWDQGEGWEFKEGHRLELDLFDRLGGLQVEARHCHPDYLERQVQVITRTSKGPQVSEVTMLESLF